MPKTTAKYFGLRAADSPATQKNGCVKEILLAFSLSVLPLLAFSGLLLGLVFRYQFTPQGHNDARIPDENPHLNKSIIYVNLSATMLITVGSWSSTMAPLSLPFILAIASYPASKLLMRASDGNGKHKLPTPYQIALLLRVMSNSSLSSVWHCMVYMSAKRRRAPMSSALNIVVCTLVLGTIQSMLIFATDTWLHFTTETVPITQFYPTTYSNVSFGIPKYCTVFEGDTQYGCFPEAIRGSTSSESFQARKSKMVQQILANTSARAAVGNYYEDGHNYVYVASPTSVFHTDIDFAATTFAAETTCTPATSRCFDRDRINLVSDYSCDFAMAGSINATGTSDLLVTYFTNSTLASNRTRRYTMENPFHFGVVVAMTGSMGQPEYDDDEIYVLTERPQGPVLMAMVCESTVLDAQYVSVNGSLTRFSASPSNSSATIVLTDTLAYTPFMDIFLLQRTITDLWESVSAQQVADKFSHTFSYAVISSFGVVVEPRLAEVAQQRSSVLVAAVPVAPLVCLLVANVLVVLLAIVLTVDALMEVAKCDEVGDVQTRLSIDALVAANFETSKKKPDVRKTEDLFEEYQGGDGPRVKVEKTTEDGWKLIGFDS
ncbi:hypothetical protein TrVFT333_003352 [Trichoderma virens FT-333]|nr:hypothetical protein TrVFT333_003352 [Trichoderma virens FT-333]